VPTNTVTIKILGDASAFEKSTEVVVKTSDSMGKKLAGVFGGLQADRAAQTIKNFATDSIEAYKESEKASAALQFSFDKFPKMADSNVTAFEKLDTALAKKTKFDDDATKAAQASLGQFGLTGEQILKLTPLMQDYAAKTGTDLPTAADALGKAMLGKGKALAAIGIHFKDTGSAAGNFDEVIGGLRTQVGGFAEKEGKTAAGRSEILKNQMGELQETIGSKLLPVLSGLTSYALKVVDVFNNLSPTGQKVVGVVLGLVVGVIAVSKAIQAWTAIQAAFNVVMGMNPIVLVGLAIAALVVGVIYAYKHCETFRDIVDGAFKAVAAAAVWVRDAFMTAFHAIGDAATWLWENAIKPAWDAISLGIAVGVAVASLALQPLIGAFQLVASTVSWMWDNVLRPVLGFIGTAIGFLWETQMKPAVALIAGGFHLLGDGLSWVWGNVLSPVFDKIGSAAKGLAGIIGGALGAIADVAKAPLNGLIWLINKVIDGLNLLSIKVPNIPGVPHAGETIGVHIPHIPQLAAGGIVRARPGGVLVNVAEGGHDEVITPLDGRPRGGGDTHVYNFTLNGIVDAASARRAVVEVIESHLSLGGTITNKRGGSLQVA
jgi:phage-related protein